MAIRLALMGVLALVLVWYAGLSDRGSGARIERGSAGLSSGGMSDGEHEAAGEALPVPGGSLADVPGEFLDADGHSRRLHTLRGRRWVASAIYTRCATVCPRVVEDLRALERAWAADTTWGIVLFSLDPAHDRPQVLRAFAAARGLAAPRWTLVVPDSAALEQLARTLGLIARADAAGGIAHSAVFAYVDADGRILDRRVGLSLPRGGLARAWRRLRAGA